MGLLDAIQNASQYLKPPVVDPEELKRLVPTVGWDGQPPIGTRGPNPEMGQQAAPVQAPAPQAPVPPLSILVNSQTRPRWAGGAPPTPESSGVTGDTTATRERIAEPADYLRNQIAQNAVTPAANQNGRLKSILASAGMGALQAAAQGGDWRRAIGGAIGGGLGGAVNPAFDEQMRQDYKQQQDQAKLQSLDQNQIAGLQAPKLKAVIAGQLGNIGYKQGQLGVAQQRAETGRLAVTNRKAIEDARISQGYDRLSYQGKRDLANRVAKMFNDAKEFDPDDEKNADMVAAMEASGLTPFKKTASTPTKYIQDQETGQWYIGRGGEISTAKGPGGGDFKTAAPHQITLANIEARATAAAKNAKTAREAKLLADKSRADSWNEAAGEYERQAKENEGTRAGNAAKDKAVRARQKAGQYGAPPVQRPIATGASSGMVSQ